MKRLLSFPPISFTLEAFSTYGRCGVAQAAAALSYFLILTLFPLLMCVNYFIGLFHLSLEQLLSGLDQVLPDQALAVMQDYLAYASLNQSPAIVAAAWWPSPCPPPQGSAPCCWPWISCMAWNTPAGCAGSPSA